MLAGPTCARTLAEHGAEVLKITAAHLPDSGAIELDTGIGKLAAHLDLRTAQGVEILRSLLRGADVFTQSYRPGALAARGFSPKEAAQLRPGIVYVSLNAWGQTGPWKDRRGFDSIVQTVSGMAQASGDGVKPKLLPVSAIDYVSGCLMAYGAMVALARRAREGGSWLVRVALARTGKWIVDRGTVDDSAAPADLPPEELAQLCMQTQSPAGVVGHLKPVVQMSATPPPAGRGRRCRLGTTGRSGPRLRGAVRRNCGASPDLGAAAAGRAAAVPAAGAANAGPAQSPQSPSARRCASSAARWR
ncbi:MAG: CoA transferase [Proteobacteria bacterium]|nr:CoA transferase [Pseudomonadota bacterium]